jgi:hypothetical protein
LNPYAMDYVIEVLLKDNSEDTMKRLRNCLEGYR